MNERTAPPLLVTYISAEGYFAAQVTAYQGGATHLAARVSPFFATQEECETWIAQHKDGTP